MTHEAEIPVTFSSTSGRRTSLPGKTVYVLEGTTLVEAAAEADIVIELPCGGQGICGNCRVVVRDGASEPTDEQRDALTAEELDAGVRLACRSTVHRPMTVEVPAASLPAAYHKIIERTEDAGTAQLDSAIRKLFVELPLPERGDADADLVRLQRALAPLGVGPLEIGLDLLREIPGRLRETGFRGTAVLNDGHLIDFEPGNTETELFAVVVDVGTTTLVGVLLDLNTGQQRAVCSRLNPQTRFGDDVLSRILHVQQDPEGLNELHESIVGAVNEMIAEMIAEADVSHRQIYDAAFAGNTTMQQLLLRIDPSSLAQVPFVPTAATAPAVQAAELALHVHPRASVHTLPVIGGFVGGDISAGILATELAESEGPALLVDIGTNGEIVLFADGKLSAASTAAGPAFEGARISRGMRGSQGAIEKVVVDGRLRIHVIGGVAPMGICGSALIDLAAELLRHDLLTPQGRLLTRDELPDGVLPDLADRLVQQDGRPAFVVASAVETDDEKPIVLTQQDLRELQLATGAIRAGIAILLHRAGHEPADLESVMIGGGFGNFIRRSNAQRIGLLPGRVEHRRIRYRGNTSLAGARLAALSRRARATAEELARRTEHVDLSLDAQFHETFAAAMIFPGEDDVKEKQKN